MNKEKNKFQQFEEYLARKHSRLSIIFIYNFVFALTGYIFIMFLIIPLMNYNPDTVEYVEKYSVSRINQYISMLIPTVLFNIIILNILLRKFKNWYKYKEDDNVENIKNLIQIRNKCLTFPYKIYILQVIIMLPVVGIIFSLISISNGTNILIVVKLIIILIGLFSFTGLISLIFSKRIFTIILVETSSEILEKQKHPIIKFGIKRIMLIQIIPIIAVIILFTSLIGVNNTVNARGELLFEKYKEILYERFNDFKISQNIDEYREVLQSIDIGVKGKYFIVNPSEIVFTSDNSLLSPVITKYIFDFSYRHNGRIYDEMSTFGGAVIDLESEEGLWKVGVIYEVTQTNTLNSFIINFLLLFLTSLIILYYLIRSLSMNISHLSKNLTRISEREKVDNNEKLPVISNDELGDMTIAFNKILDIENNHIEDIKKTTEHMMDQEKFISLGHLIGGIAHNFRTPIMSISGALIKLKRLIEEYDQAIGDKEVNNEDHKEIAKEMMEWISKIEPYCGYMSGMLSAVKNQIAGENINDDLSFRIGDLVDSATFLMEHELKISGCTLKTKINMDLETIVKGDISVIIQIIGNLIQNSIYAYNKKGGDIIFEINDKKSVLELLIRDFGAGISKEIENKIFREMITTKGNKGSGLGLFIAKNSLKAKMNGKIYFESELKKGTTFHIEIPMK